MKIFTRSGALHIEFQGFERFWALKRRLVIPFENISSLEFHDTWQRPNSGAWLRLGGTFLPRILMAGRYRYTSEQYFAYVSKITGSGLGEIGARNVAVITTHDYAFKQLFISVDSASDLPRL